MKRICHVAQSYYARDPRVRREAEALAEAGFQVDVICLRDAGEKRFEVINGVNVRRLPLTRRSGGKARYIFEYLAFFVGVSMVFVHRIFRKYDLIHINNMPDFLVFSTLLPKLLGAKVLLDVHDPMPELFMSKYGMKSSHPAIRLLLWQEKISVRFSDHVLTVTDGMKERLRQHSKEKPIGIVLNLPDESIFRWNYHEHHDSTEKSRFVVVYTGTIGERYGLNVAIRAAAILRDQIPEFKLLLVGEGDNLPSLRKLTRELGLEGVVEFRRPVPLSQVPKVVAGCDIGISPHIDDVFMRLSLSTKVAEYAAMGLPCVVTRTKTMEHYFDEHTVRYCKSGDPRSFADGIAELYANPELRRRMAQNCRDLARRRNWAAEKAKYLDVVNRILDGGDEQ